MDARPVLLPSPQTTLLGARVCVLIVCLYTFTPYICTLYILQCRLRIVDVYVCVFNRVI